MREGRVEWVPSPQTQTSISSIPDSHSDSPNTSERQATHQRFVLTDPVAFRYLEEDPSTHVLARREKLEGYECYIVEQWACSRTHPTFVITTYTGVAGSTVIGNVLSVPTNEDSWSPRLKVYFKALNQYHARRKETPLGTLMITNLSGFPSSLTVIPIPEGDAKTHREDFFVNENLKRLGCSGRVGLTLQPPNLSTKQKFYQLYRASEKIPLGAAVIELVKLCQLALMLFDKLDPEYADGLLCDVTEKAINDWWIEFGSDYYNIEPHDGILGPTTVSALLGLLTGARNRLHAFNAPIGKDVFDVESTKRAIAYFQRSQHLPKSRRLDRQTLSRLHKSTAKAASGEGWLVPRAVKSTVAELSGKGGEMVMDMVAGGREKVGIADVETVDIELFVQLIVGSHSKWLWQGKPRKSNTGDMFNRLTGDDGLVFQSNDQGGYEWSRKKDASGDSPKDLSRVGTNDSQRRDLDDRTRLTKSKPQDRSQSNRAHDSGRGFSRLKDAVGLGGHSSKHQKDAPEMWREDGDNSQTFSDGTSASRLRGDASTSYPSPDTSSQISRNPIFTKVISETPIEFPGTFSPRIEPPSDDDEPSLDPAIQLDGLMGSKSLTPSITGSTYRGVDLGDALPGDEMPDQNTSLLLRRRNSYTQFEQSNESTHDSYWPRHGSFSVAEESIFKWKNINPPIENDITQVSNLHQLATLEHSSTEDAKRMRAKLTNLETTVVKWVQNQISSIQSLDDLIDKDQEELNEMYYPRLEEYQHLRQNSKDMLEMERVQLEETVKELEDLGLKLDYEIGTLKSKVEDVEDGVGEFERQIRLVEGRVERAEWKAGAGKGRREGWGRWAFSIPYNTEQSFVSRCGGVEAIDSPSAEFVDMSDMIFTHAGSRHSRI
ncbi:hypothetical protein EJ08DRAFT_670652 [Tothia fuscella]|uniref:STB6-like N-terminal domain-containing protein n=1 Tax=Tothia fuscella TaxID=1048955 RepID=A0A9P4NRG2_9PEZI|nr:hypothetical protein EJ08DRAFT_670652 [Tothia fuscella]